MVWQDLPQLYVVGIPGSIGVGKTTNVTFMAFSGGAAVNNTSIKLDGAASARGVTNKDGILVLPVNATSGGRINITAGKTGYENSTTFMTAVPGIEISASPPSITSGTAMYVTFSVMSIGEPVDGASVNLSGAGIALDGITNSDGQIILQVNAPDTGTIAATAKKAGYAEGMTAITSTGQQTLSISSSHATVTLGVPTHVTFTATAIGSPVSGATISLSGATVGSGITNQDGKAIILVNPQSTGTITATASETGYTSGSTTLTSTGTQPLSIASSLSTITTGVPSYVLFTVTSGDNFISEANVTLAGAASGTGITNQNGQVILYINSSSGTVTASASKAGYASGSTSLNALGQQTISVAANPSNITNGVAAYVTFTVTSAGSAVSGATVSVSGGGINTDGVTNSAGQVTLMLNSADTTAINVVARKTGYIDGLTTITH